MTIYERIRQLRIDAHMSQDDLARAMGYKDRSMITKIESGKVDISQKKIIAFARVLNTTPGYLMGWTDQSDKTSDHPPDSSVYIPHTPQARSLARGMDRMPESQRNALMQMLNGLCPGIFENEGDDTSES